MVFCLAAQGGELSSAQKLSAAPVLGAPLVAVPPDGDGRLLLLLGEVVPVLVEDGDGFLVVPAVWGVPEDGGGVLGLLGEIVPVQVDVVPSDLVLLLLEVLAPEALVVAHDHGGVPLLVGEVVPLVVKFGDLLVVVPLGLGEAKDLGGGLDVGWEVGPVLVDPLDVLLGLLPLLEAVFPGVGVVSHHHGGVLQLVGE